MKKKYPYERPNDFSKFPIENKNAFLAYLLHLEKSKLDSKENYFENHHILLHSLGGSNEAFNMVTLSYEDHFIAHYLLYKACPSNREICSAFAIMHGRNKNKTAVEYSYDRKQYSKDLSESLKGENNPNFGNTMSDAGKLALSRAHKGKVISEKQRKEHSIRMKGENNPVYGKTGIHSEEGLQKIREVTTGATWMKGEGHPMFNVDYTDTMKDKTAETGCKAIFVTPYGEFLSVRSAVNKIQKIAPKFNKLNLYTFCGYSNKADIKILKKWSFNYSETYRRLFKEKAIGKTFKELGWSFRLKEIIA